VSEALIFTNQIRGIIRQASDVIGFCCQLVGAVGDIPKEILTIRHKVTDIRHNVKALESLANTNEDVYDIDNFRALISRNGSLQRAIGLLGQLTELIGVQNTDVLYSNTRGKNNWEAIKSRLVSLFKKKGETRELMDNLHTCCDSITFTLATTTA
jgi:hypothetical protein